MLCEAIRSRGDVSQDTSVQSVKKNSSSCLCNSALSTIR